MCVFHPSSKSKKLKQLSFICCFEMCEITTKNNNNNYIIIPNEKLVVCRTQTKGSPCRFSQILKLSSQKNNKDDEEGSRDFVFLWHANFHWSQGNRVLAYKYTCAHLCDHWSAACASLISLETSAALVQCSSIYNNIEFKSICFQICYRFKPWAKQCCSLSSLIWILWML